MNTEQIIMIMEAILFACVLLSIVYAIGVVWRVEEELDISYKLLLVAIISFGAAELISVFEGLPKGQLVIYVVGLKTLFSILFLFGVYAMRDLVRKIDGEKGKK